MGLSGQLWTRRLIGELIFKLYQVRFTEPGVGKYLKRWGQSFQRPDKQAVEQDSEAARLWREETWPAIRARAKADNGEVLFADRVGIRSDQVTGRTRGGKGITPVVRRTGNRFSVNAMSAISTKGRDALHGLHRVLRCEDYVPLPRPARRPQGRDRAALPALVLTRAEPGRVGQRRPQTQAAAHSPGQEPERTRHRNPQVLPPPTTPAPTAG
ncbi:hypothetical protein FNQ90_02580 [Streptomyces alkaliphilus]|uniref:Winged helix-turn helix domain-containing protein n=1 Tax=Streptomyces alkaliphilus TaxID=1472722 RepID=A0A7W3TA47_9ACTN|nr:hypothetical protein [Streptomyces alkaliphilus]